MEELIFSSSYAALTRALGPLLTPAVMERFRAHGIHLDRALASAYPVATWLESLKVVADVLAPGKPEDEAMRVVGARMLEGYAQTLVGRALFSVLRVIGFKKSLDRVAKNLRTTNNYSEARIDWEGPGRCRLWVSKVRSPPYYQGVFEAALEALGAKDIVVTLLRHDPVEGTTFSIAFAEP